MTIVAFTPLTKLGRLSEAVLAPARRRLPIRDLSTLLIIVARSRVFCSGYEQFDQTPRLAAASRWLLFWFLGTEILNRQ